MKQARIFRALGQFRCNELKLCVQKFSAQSIEHWIIHQAQLWPLYNLILWYYSHFLKGPGPVGYGKGLVQIYLSKGWKVLFTILGLYGRQGPSYKSLSVTLSVRAQAFKPKPLSLSPNLFSLHLLGPSRWARTFKPEPLRPSPSSFKQKKIILLCVGGENS